MPFAPITITDGQVSGVDDLSSASSSVVNWEIDDAGVNKPRPPLVDMAATGLASSAIIGGERFFNYTVWAAADRSLRAIPEITPSVATAITTASSQLEGTAIRATFVAGQNYIYVAGGGRIQRWNSSLATSAVVSGSFNCTHIASLGQRLISNNLVLPNQFQWSDLGEGNWTSWPAANFSNADAKPDPIVGLVANINELYVLGDSTTQVYSVSTDPTLPFNLNNTMAFGLAAPYAYALLDDNLVMLDNFRRIVITDGRVVKSISTAIQNDLRGLSTISDCWMYRESRGQYDLIVVRFPTARRTFVYDQGSQRWTERAYYSSPFQTDFPAGAYVYWPSLNYHMIGSSLTTGGIYRLGTSAAGDLTSSLVAERTTGWHDHGSDNRKRSQRIRATMRRGTGTVNVTPGALEIRWQDDDKSWTSWKPISVGQPSDYVSVRDVFTGGIFRRRRYGIRFSTTESMSLVKLADEVTELFS